MFGEVSGGDAVYKTSRNVIIPFYGYASLAFLIAIVFIFFWAPAFTRHYFHPKVIAATHLMALGWGTMMILGFSHQVVPAVTKEKLYSSAMALLSFGLAATGIPLLVYSFYTFEMGWMAKTGGILMNGAVLVYLINLILSLVKSRVESIIALFILTAGLWLFLTTLIGILLIYNFSIPLFSEDSLHFLSLHAHLGIIGWFLLQIIGLTAYLVTENISPDLRDIKSLNRVYLLINAGLITFIFMFLRGANRYWYLIAVMEIVGALLLFFRYWVKMRRQHTGDKPAFIRMKYILLLGGFLLLSVILLAVLLLVFAGKGEQVALMLAYGFSIFFGWITAFILSITFRSSASGVPKESSVYRKEFSESRIASKSNKKSLLLWAVLIYITGYLLFLTGVLLSVVGFIQIATLLLLAVAVIHNFGVIHKIFEKSEW